MYIVMAVKGPDTRIVRLECENIGDSLLNKDCVATRWIRADAAAAGRGDPVVKALDVGVEPCRWQLSEDLKMVAVEMPEIC